MILGSQKPGTATMSTCHVKVELSCIEKVEMYFRDFCELLCIFLCQAFFSQPDFGLQMIAVSSFVVSDGHFWSSKVLLYIVAMLLAEWLVPEP